MFTHCHRSADKQNLLAKRFVWEMPAGETARTGTESTERPTPTPDRPRSEVEAAAQRERQQLAARVTSAQQMVTRLRGLEGTAATNLRNEIRAQITEIQRSRLASEFSTQISSLRSGVVATLTGSANLAERTAWSQPAFTAIRNGINALRNPGQNLNTTQMMGTLTGVWKAVQELLAGWGDNGIIDAIRGYFTSGNTPSRPNTNTENTSNTSTTNTTPGSLSNAADSAREGAPTNLDSNFTSINTFSVADDSAAAARGLIKITHQALGQTVAVYVNAEGGGEVYDSANQGAEPLPNLANPVDAMLSSKHGEIVSLQNQLGLTSEADKVALSRTIIEHQKVENQASNTPTDIARLLNDHLQWAKTDPSSSARSMTPAALKRAVLARPSGTTLSPLVTALKARDEAVKTGEATRPLREAKDDLRSKVGETITQILPLIQANENLSASGKANAETKLRMMLSLAIGEGRSQQSPADIYSSALAKVTQTRDLYQASGYGAIDFMTGRVSGESSEGLLPFSDMTSLAVGINHMNALAGYLSGRTSPAASVSGAGGQVTGGAAEVTS